MCRPSRSSSSGLKSLSERPVYLVSDLHLEPGRPLTTALFIDFLHGPARRARALYILGDLFEAWIGDDAPLDPAPELATALSELSQAGTPVYFIAGNRDFLLGEDYARRAGMVLLDEPYRLPDCPETVLMHGDQLCTDDLAYQRFRRKVRNPGWQRRILSRPVWWRRLLARLARFLSRRRTGRQAAEIMDVNERTVREWMARHQARVLIHGHTHRPAIHPLTIDDQPCRRIVLGDWHDSGSAVRLLDGQAELLQISRDGDGQVHLAPHPAAHPPG